MSDPCMTISEACEILRVDNGVNDGVIYSLIDALPYYVEVATGYPITAQRQEPLCKTVYGFLLLKWYYADHADDQALTRSIDSLLKTISVIARERFGYYNEPGI